MEDELKYVNKAAKGLIESICCGMSIVNAIVNARYMFNM